MSTPQPTTDQLCRRAAMISAEMTSIMDLMAKTCDQQSLKITQLTARVQELDKPKKK